MSFPSIEIICEKCGGRINRIINMKSVKDVLRPFNGRCNSCGVSLNPYDFVLQMEKT
jgi:hypothetical protein